MLGDDAAKEAKRFAEGGYKDTKRHRQVDDQSQSITAAANGFDFQWRVLTKLIDHEADGGVAAAKRKARRLEQQQLLEQIQGQGQGQVGQTADAPATSSPSPGGRAYH